MKICQIFNFVQTKLGTNPNERKKSLFFPDNSMIINTAMFIMSNNFTPLGMIKDGETLFRIVH